MPWREIPRRVPWWRDSQVSARSTNWIVQHHLQRGTLPKREGLECFFIMQVFEALGDDYVVQFGDLRQQVLLLPSSRAPPAWWPAKGAHPCPVCRPWGHEPREVRGGVGERSSSLWAWRSRRASERRRVGGKNDAERNAARLSARSPPAAAMNDSIGGVGAKSFGPTWWPCG